MTSLRPQEEQVIVNEPFAFYSYISSPSFEGFEQDEKLDKFILDPYVREVMLGNLKGTQVKLAMLYYDIIDDCHRVADLDLAPTANTFARKLLRLVLISMGTEQSHLKTMLTNYSITEQKTEEAIKDLREEEKKEDDKKWRFLPKRR